MSSIGIYNANGTIVMGSSSTRTTLSVIEGEAVFDLSNVKQEYDLGHYPVLNLGANSVYIKVDPVYYHVVPYSPNIQDCDDCKYDGSEYAPICSICGTPEMCEAKLTLWKENK